MKVVSAHAPHEMGTAANKDLFWDDLHEVLLGSFNGSGDFELLCIDANKRVGLVPSPALGAEQSSAENDNGCRFRTLLEPQGSAAINTFFPAGNTWCSQRGHFFRITT